MLRLLGLLLFLGTAVVVLLAAGAIVFGVTARRPGFVRLVALGTFAWLAVYAVLLLASPLLYPARVLGPGEERAFCGLDCHLKLAVLGVRVDSAAGSALTYRIRLRVRSDARVEPEHPSALSLRVVDERGRAWEVLAPEERGLGRGPLARPVLPGESYIAEVAVRLPRDVQAPRLVAQWRGAADYLIPFEENTRVQRKVSQTLVPGEVRS
jgi:hypothetical protein